MKTQLSLLFASLVLLSIYACQEEDPKPIHEVYYSVDEEAVLKNHLNLPTEVADYSLDFPDYYPVPVRTTNNNMATLGRVIFYDKNLSQDRTISCGSCHKQDKAFSDDVAFSKGVADHRSERNSLALGAVFSFAEYYGNPTWGQIPFLWDNRAISVAQQAELAFMNEKEMGITLNEVVKRINEEPYYQPLLKKAYGFSHINKSIVLAAIDVFVNSIGSNHSRFDQVLENNFDPSILITEDVKKDFVGFTPQENLGKAIFLQDCAACHGSIVNPPASIASNNGLDLEYADQGIGTLTHDAPDMGMFKVPPIRNVALTAPYMHDGRFASLGEVIDHYSQQIQPHANLGNQLKTDDGAPNQFDYSQAEKEALVAFLHTLTDEAFLNDERFSDPFKK